MIQIEAASLLINNFEPDNNYESGKNLIDITPKNTYIQQDYQIFKNIITYKSYLYIKNKIIPIASIHAGFGIINVIDIQKQSKDYIIYSVSSGSGMLNTTIVNLNLNTYEEDFVYTYNSFDFTALALLKNEDFIEIFKFHMRDMNFKLPFEQQTFEKNMFGRLKIDKEITVLAYN